MQTLKYLGRLLISSLLYRDIVKLLAEMKALIEQTQRSNIHFYEAVFLQHMLSRKLERLNKLIAEFDEAYPRMLKLTGQE